MMDSIKSKVAALAIAAILAFAVAPVAFAQQVHEEEQKDVSFEDCFVLAIIFVQDRVDEIVEDAVTDDEDLEETYDELVEDVADNDNIEEEITDELAAMVETNQTNVTMQGESPDLSEAQLENVSELIVNEAIADEVLETNPEVSDAVETVIIDAFSEALTDPEADIVDIAGEIQEDIEDAIDDTLSEDEVVAVVESLDDSDIEESLDNDEIDLEQVVDESGVEGEVTPTPADTGALESELETLNEQIDQLTDRVDAIEQMIEEEHDTANATATNSTAG